MHQLAKIVPSKAKAPPLVSQKVNLFRDNVISNAFLRVFHAEQAIRGLHSLESTKIYTQVSFERTRRIAELFALPGD